MVKQVARRDAQYKFRVVMELLTSGKTAEQVCLEYGVKRSTLYGWRDLLLSEGARVFLPDGRGASEQAQLVELERMIGRLTMEVEALKKASSLLNSRSQKGAA